MNFSGRQLWAGRVTRGKHVVGIIAVGAILPWMRHISSF
jgi:hypothetical protein